MGLQPEKKQKDPNGTKFLEVSKSQSDSMNRFKNILVVIF